MKLTRENIEEYVERFLDGRTTCAEEQALYEYFRTRSIPPEWEYLRDAFAYFENGMRQQAVAGDTMPAAAGGDPAPGESGDGTRRRSLRRLPLWSAAASVAAAAVVCAWLLAPTHEEMPGGTGVSIYEGSYIILNGEYCNDIETMDYHIDIAMERAEVMAIKADRLLAMGQSSGGAALPQAKN